MTIPVNPMPTDNRQYSNITPFTVRDNATYIIVLESMRQYINNKLVPFINTNISNLDKAWTEKVFELITSWDTQSAELIAEVETIAAGLGTAVSDAQAAKAAAEAARDLAEQFASDAEDIQDVAISGIAGDSNSVTRTLLDGLYAGLSEFTTAVANITEVSDDVASRLSDNTLDAKYAQIIYVDKDIKKDFGAVGDGVTYDDDAFRAAFTQSLGATPDGIGADRSGEFVKLHIPYGTYRVRANIIEWDLYRCIVESQQAIILIESESIDDIGVKVTSTAPRVNGTTIYNHAVTNGNLTIQGATTERLGTAMYFEGQNGMSNLVSNGHRIPANATLDHFVISGFHKAIEWGLNAYMIGFKSSSFNDCNIFTYMEAGTGNAGERIFFEDCSFMNQVSGQSNNPVDVYANPTWAAIVMNADQSFVFQNCSFDWVARLLITAVNSHIFFDQCHFETPHVALVQAPAIASGDAYIKTGAHSLVSINQSRFLFSGTAGAQAIPYLADNNAWGTLSVNDSTFYSLSPHILAWSRGKPARLRNVETLQADPTQTMPMPSINQIASLTRASWNFETVDPDWTFSGGVGTGDLVTTPKPAGATNSMQVSGTNTEARLVKSVKGFTRHAGISAEIIAGDSSGLSVTLVCQVLDANNEIISNRSKSFTINSTGFTRCTIAVPFSPDANRSLRLVDKIRFVIRNSSGTLYAARVVADYWE